MIKWVWTCTWKLRSSEIGVGLRGRRSEHCRLGGVMRTDMQFLSESTRNGGNLTSWQCFWACVKSWLVAVELVGRYAGSMKLHSVVNLVIVRINGDWLTDSDFWVDAVLHVCCIWCMLNLVCTVLCVNSWSRHGETEKGDLTSCSQVMIELRKIQRDGGWKWNQYGGFNLVGNLGYNLPDWLQNTSCGDSDLPYREWYIDSQMEFSDVPVSHHDILMLISFLSYLSSTLPSPKNMTLWHLSLSLHVIIMSEH